MEPLPHLQILLVIGLTSVLFMNNASNLVKYLGNTTGSNTLFVILVGALGINGLIEAVFTAILTPIIVLPLKKVLKRIII